MTALTGQEPTSPLPVFPNACETQRVLEGATLAAKHRAVVRLSAVKWLVAWLAACAHPVCQGVR